MLIETEKSPECSKPNLVVADPLDMRNLETLRRLATTDADLELAARARLSRQRARLPSILGVSSVYP